MILVPIESAYTTSYYTVSQKRDSDVIDCIFKKDYQIFTIFGTNIPETTGHQMAIQFPTSPNSR